MRQRIVTLCVLALLVAFGFLAPRVALHPQPALAGHAIQDGNCWQDARPLLCKTTYDCAPVPPYINENCPTQQLRVRIVDYFSDGGQSAWRVAMTAAAFNWNVFSGPQDFQEYDRTDDTYVYNYDSVTGQNGLGSSSFGLTYNCNTSSYCTSSAFAMDIYFSKVYFNKDKMNSLFIGDDDRTNVFAHEWGHTLGLYHHNSTSLALMYAYQQPNIQGPQYPYEWGSTPVCLVPSTFGIRCIYDIGGTPPP